ncbi:MAG: hypothetical protein H7Z14_07885 [Anaerolineae bacterium]|nr:hypothetical protein [Phycisphaerae bacterium]
MPKPNDYSRGRFIAMQASMWGILLCTVGIAALASKYKRGSADVKLGEPRVIDSISVRLPKGWTTSRDGADGWRATERASPALRRVILVREKDPEEMSLLERFMGGQAKSPTTRGGSSPGIPMGPVTGIVTSTRTESRTYEEVEDVFVQATARLPNDHLLTITLVAIVTEEQDEIDAIELVKKIAASVQYLPAKDLSEDRK